MHDHCQLTRRDFLQLGSAAVAAWSVSPLPAADAGTDPQLLAAISKLEYLTPLNRAFILDKGKAGVTKLPLEKLREIGLTPDTWSLEVVPDPASNSVVEQPLSCARGNALDWQGLMRLAQKHAVRFMHVCTCTNGQDPFHMSLWEGVPLREVIALTRPRENVRRVYYQSHHGENLPPFQSSVALGQILEAPPGQMPVILAYKMNGQLIPASHGGPVRMIVPGSYGSKSTKWVKRIVLTNDYKSNDSDAELNNDPENQLKTRARFINAPREIPSGKPAALTGMAQVGVSGLKKVQYCIQPHQDASPAADPFWTKADWKDATILPPPADWGGGLPGGKLPPTAQTDPATGKPLEWPLRYTLVHWAVLLPGLRPGSYDVCCRTIDGNGLAQPFPRTLPRTGFNTLHVVNLAVKA
ncbi:MAG TPA: molybdopterin-dependent oxidoreductase [Bacillota bacterium]|nr:molybdopterin-dependent oxidoreductase [Bacillota bacterium]